MRERQEFEPRPFRVEITEADWDLIIASVDEYLRAYTDASSTWWEPVDERPTQLAALLDKLRPHLRGCEDPSRTEDR